MNYKSRLFLIFSTTFLMFNCSRNEIVKNIEIPYYQFTQDERTNLVIQPKINDEFIYKNQFNELMKFTVYRSDILKNAETTASFLSQATINFYYENQEIVMHTAGTNNEYKIDILKYPVDSNYSGQNPVVGTPTFYGFIDFPAWNGYFGNETHVNEIVINFNFPTTTMTFQGKTYSKVRVFESNKTVVLDPTYTYKRNVHIVYYDYNYGVIGFDDLDGKLWRLQ